MMNNMSFFRKAALVVLLGVATLATFSVDAKVTIPGENEIKGVSMGAVG